MDRPNVGQTDQKILLKEQNDFVNPTTNIWMGLAHQYRKKRYFCKRNDIMASNSDWSKAVLNHCGFDWSVTIDFTRTKIGSFKIHIVHNIFMLVYFLTPIFLAEKWLYYGYKYNYYFFKSKYLINVSNNLWNNNT